MPGQAARERGRNNGRGSMQFRSRLIAAIAVPVPVLGIGLVSAGPAFADAPYLDINLAGGGIH